MPRDKFMDEVVEGAPLKEKKKRPRKKKQITQWSVPTAVSTAVPIVLNLV